MAFLKKPLRGAVEGEVIDAPEGSSEPPPPPDKTMVMLDTGAKYTEHVYLEMPFDEFETLFTLALAQGLSHIRIKNDKKAYGIPPKRVVYFKRYRD